MSNSTTTHQKYYTEKISNSYNSANEFYNSAKYQEDFKLFLSLRMKQLTPEQQKTYKVLQFICEQIRKDDQSLKRLTKIGAARGFEIDYMFEEDEKWERAHYVDGTKCEAPISFNPLTVCFLDSFEKPVDDKSRTRSLLLSHEYNRFVHNFISIANEIEGTDFWTVEKYEADGYIRELTDNLLEVFVRACLSRIHGEAVLGVLEQINYNLNQFCKIYESDTLYLAFDEPLRNGKSLDEAIEALHTKMLDLVPEYVTFCEEQAKQENN